VVSPLEVRSPGVEKGTKACPVCPCCCQCFWHLQSQHQGASPAVLVISVSTHNEESLNVCRTPRRSVRKKCPISITAGVQPAALLLRLVEEKYVERTHQRHKVAGCPHVPKPSNPGDLRVVHLRQVDIPHMRAECRNKASGSCLRLHGRAQHRVLSVSSTDAGRAALADRPSGTSSGRVRAKQLEGVWDGRALAY